MLQNKNLKTDMYILQCTDINKILRLSSETVLKKCIEHIFGDISIEIKARIKIKESWKYLFTYFIVSYFDK